jgi:hypothetical protein
MSIGKSDRQDDRYLQDPRSSPMLIPAPLTAETRARHLRELDENGFTLVRRQLDPSILPALRDIAQRSADDYVAAWRAGLELAKVHIVDTPEKTRNFYLDPNAKAAHLWGDDALVLLDHDSVHDLSAGAMGTYAFSDMIANTLRPEPDRPWGFHRDHGHGLTAGGKHTYLWFFFILDGYTADNGATWVVPGTHRYGPGEPEPEVRPEKGGSEPFIGRKVQIIGDPGDIAVVNPGVLHAGGKNRTNQPRRTLNVRVAQPDGTMFMDHWHLAGPERRAKLSPRALRFISPPAGRTDLAKEWPVMPQTAAR